MASTKMRNNKMKIGALSFALGASAFFSVLSGSRNNHCMKFRPYRTAGASCR